MAAPRCPRTDATVTIVPRPSFSICGTNVRRVLKWASVLTRKVLFGVSADVYVDDAVRVPLDFLGGRIED